MEKIFRYQQKRLEAADKAEVHKFSDYNGLERLVFPISSGKITGVSGVILAGGKSSRMGSNKALLPYKGGRFIEAIHRQMSEIFAEVILVTNNPEQYEFLPCRKVPDLIPHGGALAGIHSGLFHSANPAIFVVACDMPYLSNNLIRHLAGRADIESVLIPEGPAGLEPLHAVYGRGCLAAIEESLANGEKRILSFFDRVKTIKINAEHLAAFDPAFASFSNINTPVEYFQMRDSERQNGQNDPVSEQTLARSLTPVCNDHQM
jgi:FdhD protein